MPYCSFCGTELAADVRFCSDCGKPASKSKAVPGGGDVATIEIDYEATATSPLPPRSPSSQRSSSRAAAATDYLVSEGRFLPGRLIAGRYRIVALVGKGGMGEVYRADDLTLGQAVAMKFLPEEATSHEGMLERFKNEVRIARRVSHPNVCRVYDVGDVDGATFFTMEYVDGEDLASLIRRIGRLPQDKAVEIARQVCAGLAAAHAKGVLHRDLKPANVMLDGRGQVVITDFGLAGIADDIRGDEVRSGTPAYMAPEQLEGREVTMLSDIYALGLVLYEVFTGKRAFAEKTSGLHGYQDRTPSRPSSVIKDIDPIIEKVILRCLEIDPARRPATALSVAAALPGGDPLAAALAAGETPSPELVAASGETTGFRPPVAIACLVATLVGFAIGIFLHMRYSAVEKIHPQLPPEVLVAKSREVIAKLGYPDKPADTAYDFGYDTSFLDAVEKENPKPNWDQVLSGRPDPLQFWYRQSPDEMTPLDYQDFLLTPGVAKEEDPPTTLSGMVNTKLDANGRLIYFQAIPPQKETPPAPATTPDWSPLFSAADLDPAKLQPAQPQWISLAAADTRVAWTGVWPGSNRPLRVEAAAWRGKPVFFAMVGDWNKPWRMVPPKTSEQTKNHAAAVLGISLIVVLLACGGLLARRNFRRGRGDREGALRLAIVLLVLQVILWLCRSHLVLGLQTFGFFMLSVSAGLLWGAVMWMLYMAIEPWIRRRWPHALISWTRLLSGQFRDPVVGRDILIGVLFGAVWLLIFEIAFIPLAGTGAAPNLTSTLYLLGGRQALGQWFIQVPGAIFVTIEIFFILLGLKTVLRKDWLAALVFMGMFVGMRALQSSHLAVILPLMAVVYGVAALLVFRFGLVPLAVAAFTIDMLENVPFTTDFSQWYAGTSLMALLGVIAIAAWGFYHSLGGQSLWKPEND